MAAAGRSGTMSQGIPHEKVQPSSGANRRGGNMFANPSVFSMPPDSANVVLTTPGSRINVNIGSINGSVTIGAKNTVTTYRDTSYRSSDSSSTSSDSSSDSDSANSRRSKHRKHKDVRKARQQVDRPAPSGRTDRHQNPAVSRPQARPGAGQRAGQDTRYPVQDSKADSGTKLKARDLKVAQALQTFPSVCLNRDVLFKISSEFELGWRRVFRFLDLPDALIDEMHAEFCVDGLKEVVLKLLQRWSQQENGLPDASRLAEALVRANQMHAFNVLREAVK